MVVGLFFGGRGVINGLFSLRSTAYSNKDNY
uniref:Uncharacterized protein n=1 Tax=Rhizophora mucronata TaxID=61149 RepID=A0A2P2QGQ0_RHIMU